MRIPQDRFQIPRDGYLLMSCWCEAKAYYVPKSWLHDGLAPTCGPGCDNGTAMRRQVMGEVA